MLSLLITGALCGPAQDAGDLIALLRDTRESDWVGQEAAQASITREVRLEPAHAVTILIDRRVPPTNEEERAQTLSEVQRDLLLDALEQVDPQPIRKAAELSEAAARDAGEPPTTALWLLGTAGFASDAPRALRWTDKAVLDERTSRELKGAVRLAVSRIARRHPGCQEGLATALVQAERETLLGALPGIGDAGHPLGLECLADVVHFRDDARAVALGQVRRLGRSLDPRVNERASNSIRPLLRAESSTTRQEAARALAVLGDPEIVPSLLEFLEGDDPALRNASTWSLAQIAGRPAGDNAATWASWYARELEWRQHRLRSVEVDLASKDSAEQAKAILSVSRRELFVDEWADVLINVQPATPQVRLLLCRTLGQLGSVEAVPFLLETSRHGSDELHGTCRAALEAIAGRPLPDDVTRWDAVLTGRP